MNRSQFVRNSVLATGAIVGGGLSSAIADAKKSSSQTGTFNLNYGPHQGMFENHAGKNILDQIQFMYDQGFRSIEDNGFSGRSVEEQERIGNLLAKLGMTMGVFVLNKGGNGANTLTAGKQEHIDIFLNGCRQAVELAKHYASPLFATHRTGTTIRQQVDDDVARLN